MNIISTDNVQSQLDKLRRHISELVQQYADLAYIPEQFVPGQSPVPVSGKVIGAKELQLDYIADKLEEFFGVNF